MKFTLPNALFFTTLLIVLLDAIAVDAVPVPGKGKNLSVGNHSGQGTFFTPGLGACGGTDDASSPIVALAAPDFDPSTPASGNPNQNTLCGKKIRIFRNGNSVDATIRDRCPECPKGNVDMSPAVFNQIAQPAEGRVDMTWAFL